MADGEAHRMVTIAKAEAEIAVIKAECEVAVAETKVEGQLRLAELQKRAVQRFVDQETFYQSNLEAIATESTKLLNEAANPDAIDEEWIRIFFEKAKFISDPKFKQLWSAILAGEANAPGTFSRRTINLLADIEKKDAETFSRLCGFAFEDGEQPHLFITVFDSPILHQNGISFEDIVLLETLKLGLVRMESLAGYIVEFEQEVVTVNYFERRISIKLPKRGEKYMLRAGTVLLTSAGRQLYAICHRQPVPGFIEYFTEEINKDNRHALSAVVRDVSNPAESQESQTPAE